MNYSKICKIYSYSEILQKFHEIQKNEFVQKNKFDKFISDGNFLIATFQNELYVYIDPKLNCYGTFKWEINDKFKITDIKFFKKHINENKQDNNENTIILKFSNSQKNEIILKIIKIQLESLSKYMNFNNLFKK